MSLSARVLAAECLCQSVRYEVGHDVRCSRCGSLLYSLVRDGAFAHVALGTLIDLPTIRPGAHIYVGSKAAWFNITDAPPQHDELG